MSFHPSNRRSVYTSDMYDDTPIPPAKRAAAPSWRWLAVLLASILLHLCLLEWANGVIRIPDRHDQPIATVSVQLKEPMLPVTTPAKPTSQAGTQAARSSRPEAGSCRTGAGGRYRAKHGADCGHAYRTSQHHDRYQRPKRPGPPTRRQRRQPPRTASRPRRIPRPSRRPSRITRSICRPRPR